MTKENLEIANMLTLKIQKLSNYLIALSHTNTHLMVIRPGGISITFDNFKNLLDTNFNEEYEKEILDKLKISVINEINKLSIEIHNL